MKDMKETGQIIFFLNIKPKIYQIGLNQEIHTLQKIEPRTLQHAQFTGLSDKNFQKKKK